MKPEASHASKLTGFMRKHAAAGAALRSKCESDSMDLVDLFVHSYLLWQAPTADADAALARVKAAFIDWNDLRVSLDSDVVDVIGRQYWRAHERVSRMREAMNDIFRREHRVNLDRLRTLMKKDAVSYMETLRGMLPFVGNRVLLIGVQFHAIPLDEFGLAILQRQGVIPPGQGLQDATNWLVRHVKAEEARDMHGILLAATDHMWATDPPRQSKYGSRPAELAPPKSVEEAVADAQALVARQLAAEREAAAAERAAKREEARAQRLAMKAKEAREEASRSRPKDGAGKGKSGSKSAAKSPSKGGSKGSAKSSSAARAAKPSKKASAKK